MLQLLKFTSLAKRWLVFLLKDAGFGIKCLTFILICRENISDYKLVATLTWKDNFYLIALLPGTTHLHTPYPF